MNILYLCHRIPFPPNKGDKIRSFNQIRYLSERGWSVHLCAFADEPGDMAHVDRLKEYCHTVDVLLLHRRWRVLRGAIALAAGGVLSVGYHFSGRMQERVDRVLSLYPIEACVCFSSPMAEHLFRSRRLRGTFGARLMETSSPKSGSDAPNPQPQTSSSELSVRPRLVMDLVDVDSSKWELYAEQKKPPAAWLYALESKRLARYEKRIAVAFDAVLLVSEAERDLLRERCGSLSHRIRALPNGVDMEYFRPEAPGQDGQRNQGSRSIVFCGMMDYYPNVDAVVWFAREILPRLRDGLGAVGFRIVGARPTKEVRALQELPGVEVLGRVDDVRPFVLQADVSVAPIRIARGIQNKILEAMAMQKPVVATPQAFEGIQAQPGRDLLVAGTASAFTDAVSDFLSNPDRRARIAENGRRFVEARHDWNHLLEGLAELLQSSGSEASD